MAAAVTPAAVSTAALAMNFLRVCFFMATVFGREKGNDFDKD
jgi:hypothetical protein